MRCMKHNNVIVTDTGKWCEPLYCPELISSVYQLLTNTSKVPCSFLARVTFLVFVLWWLLVELSDINKLNLEIICFTWTLTTMRFYFQFNFPSQEIYQIVNVLWAAFMSFYLIHSYFIFLNSVLWYISNMLQKCTLNRFNLPWK